jgi:hypothetical protein
MAYYTTATTSDRYAVLLVFKTQRLTTDDLWHSRISKQTSYISSCIPSSAPAISKQTRLKVGSGTYPRVRSLVEEAIQGRKTYLLR